MERAGATGVGGGAGSGAARRGRRAIGAGRGAAVDEQSGRAAQCKITDGLGQAEIDVELFGNVAADFRDTDAQVHLLRFGNLQPVDDLD
mgnify:CR=1 FL=1